MPITAMMRLQWSRRRVVPRTVFAFLFLLIPLRSQDTSRQRVNELNDQVRTMDRYSRRGEIKAQKDGQFSIEDILKDDYKKSLQDIARIQKLAEGLKVEFEKNDPHVLNVSSVKMTEEIEKLAKKLRSRLRRF